MYSVKGDLLANMNSKSFRVLLIFAVATAVLVAAVSFNVRDYQDSWILEDVTVVTIVYVFAFSVFASVCDDNRLLAIGCASFLIFLDAIPNLKYDLFYGAFDSVVHYGYIRNLVSIGHVPTTGFLAPSYVDFPGMHIFIGSLSIITGFSINTTMKLVASIIFGIIPLMTYFATNRVFEPEIQRFIIVASGLPTVVTYMIAGTALALPFFFSILCLVFRGNLSRGNNRQYAIALTTVVFGLLFSHAVTTLLLISFLVIAILLLKFLSTRRKQFLKSYQRAGPLALWASVILVVSFAARLMFESGNVLKVFVGGVEDILIRQTSGIVPTRFFQVPFSAEVIFLALNYVEEAVIVLISFIGIMVLFVKLRHNNKEIYEKFYIFLLSIIVAILALLIIQVVSGFSLGYGRLIAFAMVLSPFLVGLFLWHVNEHFSGSRLGSALIALLLFSCISISLIEIFPYQPIVPKANVLSQDLPANEYIFDFRSVNTVYQEDMILFAQRYSSNNTRVASDVVTRWQIYGFADDTFINKHIYQSPLESQDLSWDMFLLHYDGKAGPLNEKVENRTNERLTELKDTLGNVVYDNGESFIIVR
jgi:hypothetical protein